MKPLFLSLFLLIVSGAANAQPIVLVAYHSKTGNTLALAEAVARGAAQVAEVTVVLKPIDQITTANLLEASAIIVGSPVYNANVTPEVQAFISSWPFENAPLKNKLGAAFVTAGGISAGEELTLMNILQSMMIFGMVVIGGPDWTAPFGASAIVHEPPFSPEQGIAPQFLKKGEGLGKRVAELTLKMSR